MVFGFRMSYHPNQLASARASSQQQQAPSVCPCASCFHGHDGEHQALRAACASPARKMMLPPSPAPTSPQHHGLSSNPFWGFYGRTRLGLLRGGLRRRRSVATMASDTRPLWEGGGVVTQEEDGQSVLEETF